MGKKVADYLKDEPNVIGYEILNEPWVGFWFTHPDRILIRGHTTGALLQPMYEKLNAKIREVDTEKLIFFEPQTFPYYGHSGFTDSPGGPEFKNKSVFSYH